LLVAAWVFSAVLLATFGLCVLNARMLGADLWQAYLVAFVAVFGSSFWEIAKEGQEEVQLALALLLGLYGFLRWRGGGQPKYVWLSAAAVAAATIFRPTAVTIVIGVVGMFLVDLWRTHRAGTLERQTLAQVTACFAVAGAGALSLILAYNAYKSGHPLHAGYARAAGYFTPAHWGDGLWGSTLGLDRGIIWQDLWLLPAAVWVGTNWRRLRPELRTAIALGGFLFLSSLLLYSTWIGWSGGLMGYGTRFQQHVMPLLALGLVLGTLDTGRRVWRWSRRSAGILAVLAAIAQLPSIMFTASLEGLQAIAAGATAPPGKVPTVALGGELHLRRANVVSKLTTGSPVALDTVAAQREIVPLLQDASRWDFIPWRLQKYFVPRTIETVKLLWVVLLLSSVGAWLVVFRRASGEADAG
jgi:hypothetical protein